MSAMDMDDVLAQAETKANPSSETLQEKASLLTFRVSSRAGGWNCGLLRFVHRKAKGTFPSV